MAKAALELAVWDCHARQLGVPLRTLLGGDLTEVPVGASLGMNPVPETVASVCTPRRTGLQADQAEDRAGLGCRPAFGGSGGVPGHRADRGRQLAYTLDDIDILQKIDQFELHYIEQPLHGTTSSTCHLAPQMQTALCLDETLTSPARVRRHSTSAACRWST